MKAVTLKLACEGCGRELVVEREITTPSPLAVRSMYCANGACKFHNQKFEPPTVELKAVE